MQKVCFDIIGKQKFCLSRGTNNYIALYIFVFILQSIAIQSHYLDFFPKNVNVECMIEFHAVAYLMALLENMGMFLSVLRELISVVCQQHSSSLACSCSNLDLVTF